MIILKNSPTDLKIEKDKKIMSTDTIYQYYDTTIQVLHILWLIIGVILFYFTILTIKYNINSFNTHNRN